MNQAILLPEVQNYIFENRNIDLSKLILKGSPFPDVSIQEIAIQISGLNKAKSKLPTWYNSKDIIYPPNLNLEQTSSEVTAKYKADLVQGKRLLDLTGGFGIDSYFFSKRVSQVIHCEMNNELSTLASHNFKILGADNIEQITGDSIEYLKNSTKTYDWIFIDPARRDNYGGKVFLLEQCTPNVTEHLDLFLQKSNNIIIKSAPLLDISSGLRELKNVSEIHVIAINNDVKEVLWLIKKNNVEPLKINTINIQKNGTQVFEWIYPDCETATYNYPLKFIYEPNSAILKSGLFNAVAKVTNTKKLHVNSHLYTSNDLVEFPGRSFELIKVIPFKKKELKKNLKIDKANITTRNFPKTVSELRKELKISDGGDNYLFFTTNNCNEKVVLHCIKTSF